MWKGWRKLKSWVEMNVLCIVDQDHHQCWVVAVEHTSLNSFSRQQTHRLWFITLKMEPHFISPPEKWWKKKIVDIIVGNWGEKSKQVQSEQVELEQYRKCLWGNCQELDQSCNLTLARRFWGTKVCLQGSKIFKICLFGWPTGRATSWKANFENYSRYSLIRWYQFLSK